MPQETKEWWKGIGEELEIDIEVAESSQVDTPLQKTTN